MRLSDERLKEIMSECDKYEITLANDPTVLGPAYLQDLIARCRTFTNHVVQLFNEVRRSKMVLDMDVRRKKAAFKISADEYLAKNAVVRNLPNIRDREAQINLMLKNEHHEIVKIDNDILDLDHVIEVVKLRHRELKDTMREIQTQRALIRDDRDTGGAYGDERPGMGVEDADGDRDAAYEPGGRTREEKKDEAEIERMILEGLGGGETVETTPEPEAVVAPVVEEVKAESVVEQIVTQPLETAPVAEIVPARAASDEDLIRDFLGQDDAPPHTTHTTKDEDSSPAIPTAPATMADDDLSDLIANL